MNFLPPEFSVAPKVNTRLVRSGEIPDELESDSLLAAIDLRRKQACAADLGPLALDHEIESSPVDSWSRLLVAAEKWIEGYVGQKNLHGYAEASNDGLGATLYHVKEVAKDGARTDHAFLEVIPRVLMNYEFADPNAEIADYARRSVGFMLEWATLPDAVDKPLAYALSIKKPEQIEDVFKALRFNDKWFREYGRVIILDPAKSPNLRGPTHNVHPASQSKETAKQLFGCPGRHWIPKMHYKMVDDAEQAGLFEVSYRHARRNHGYPAQA
jgi:hypothetical protein